MRRAVSPRLSSLLLAPQQLNGISIDIRVLLHMGKVVGVQVGLEGLSPAWGSRSVFAKERGQCCCASAVPCVSAFASPWRTHLARLLANLVNVRLHLRGDGRGYLFSVYEGGLFPLRPHLSHHSSYHSQHHVDSQHHCIDQAEKKGMLRHGRELRLLARVRAVPRPPG
jgi:hypothetical protein